MIVPFQQSWSGRIVDASKIRLRSADFPSDAIFITGLIVVCGLSTIIGIAAPLGIFGHDTLFLLDNAYRILQGQIPHRDFSSAWGPIIFLVHSVGLVLSGMRPSGLGYANALFGAAIALWAFLILRPRYSSGFACILGIYTILTVVAPFPISYNPLDFSYAMVYNRYGYALFGIIMMECGYELLGHSKTKHSLSGAGSSGAALGLLAFLKISYALVALGLIIVTTIGTRSVRARRITGLSGGFTIVTLLVLYFLRFDLSDMLLDLVTAATARRRALLWRPLSIVDWIQITSMFLFAGLSLGLGLLRPALFALVSVAAGYAFLVTNMQMDTLPLNAYAAVVLAAADGRAKPEFPKWLGVLPSFPIALTPGTRAFMLVVSILPSSIQNGMSLVGATLERQWPPMSTSLVSPGPSTGLRFRSETIRMETTGVEYKTETTGPEYVEALNDGMELLRRHSDNDGVLTFDEFNPFNYLLDRPSPRGGFAAAAYNYVFCDLAHPTAERFFGNTRYVMVRKYRTEGPDVLEVGDVAGLMLIYGPKLQSQFTAVEETEHWVLWRRK